MGRNKGRKKTCINLSSQAKVKRLKTKKVLEKLRNQKKDAPEK